MATFTSALKATEIVASISLSYYQEDVRPLITNIAPADTPLFTMSGDVPAKGLQHEWQRDTLAGATGVGTAQGTAFSASALTLPSRQSNTCQIVRTDYAVTLTEEAVSHYGVDSAFAYHTGKRMKELAKNTEAAMMLNTELVTGARKMAGLSTQITTCSAADTNASVGFKYAALGEIQQLIFDQTGEECGIALCSPKQKRQVSNWFTSINREIGNSGKTLGMSILEIDTDFGAVKFVRTRYFATANATSNELLLINPMYINKAWLQPTKILRQSMDGDMTPGVIMHELTLEVLAENAMGKLTTGSFVDDPFA